MADLYDLHGGKRAYMQLAARIGPVADAITGGREPAPAGLLTFARDRTTRQVLHDLLAQTNKLQ